MSKKNEKKVKKKQSIRYAVLFPAENAQDIIQHSCFDLVEIEYDKGAEYPQHIILPKKFDAIIKKIESLHLTTLEIFIEHSEYRIRFIENDTNDFCGGDLLHDIYSSNPSNYVNFTWNDKYPSHPKSFELIIDIAGKSAYPANNPRFKFTPLFSIVNINSDLKELSNRIDVVRKEMKRCKKSKLKKYYKEKK